MRYRERIVWESDPVDSAYVSVIRGGNTRVVQPLLSFVRIPVGERIEMTLFLKCHSNAK